MLAMDSGTWSGDRRKMEVAEGLRNTLVTVGHAEGSEGRKN